MLKFVFVVLVVLVIGVQSVTVKQFQDEVPGHEGQCLGADKKFYKLGETMKDNNEPCTRKICRGTAAPGSVLLEVQSCSNIKEKPEGCVLKKDEGKNYPDCCARLECKAH